VRIAVVVAAAALLGAGCAGRASDSSGGARPVSSTTLEITVQPQGAGGATRTRTLLCPAGGSLPRARDACRRLARLRDPFAPVPKNVACTEIYGGPQLARVAGIFRGRRIGASFNRRNGCEIARWNRVAFLFRTP
jgi:subtilisin inhibitor-like